MLDLVNLNVSPNPNFSGFVRSRSVVLSISASYLSKLRRDSVGSDFPSVRKLTNYVCAKPPESRLRQFRNTYKHSGDIRIKKVADIKIT